MTDDGASGKRLVPRRWRARTADQTLQPVGGERHSPATGAPPSLVDTTHRLAYGLDGFRAGGAVHATARSRPVLPSRHRIPHVLIHVLETVLPSKFGGEPIDYQLVEQETGSGFTRLSLVVHPAIGPVDEDALTRTFLDTIGWGDGAMKMASVLWDQAGTLTVRREAPISTKMGKVQPFHLQRR